MINEMALRDNVILLGSLSNDEIIKFMNYFDYFIMASERVVFDLVILEAMACEKKVVATKMGEISEFLEDNKNGFLIERNNSEQVYKTIKRALKTKIPVGKNARKTVMKKYDIKKVILKYEKIYKTIINS